MVVAAARFLLDDDAGLLDLGELVQASIAVLVLLVGLVVGERVTPCAFAYGGSFRRFWNEFWDGGGDW